jgi:hypothetical protein
VNPLTGLAYALNQTFNNVTVISPAQPQPTFLGTGIDSLPSDTSFGTTVTFDLGAVSGYVPIAPAIQHVYYQLDTASGAWSAAPGNSSGVAPLSGLQPGMHILYAFADDAQSAGSLNSGAGAGFAMGNISAYVFFTRSIFFNGTYSGEITGNSAATAGAVSLTMLSTGAFTGTLTYGGVKYAIKGYFDGAGYFQTTIVRKGKSPLLVTITTQLENGLDTIAGTVFDSANGSFVSSIGAGKVVYSKTNPTLLAGKYTILIPSDPLQTTGLSAPQGTGAGTLTVTSAGTLTFAGTLGDGTPVSLGSTLTNGGVWYFFLPLYSSTGMIEGTVTFENTPNTSDLDGAVTWVKPANPKANPATTFYPNGFVLNTTLIGSAYNPANGFVLTGSNGSFRAASGNLSTAIDDSSARITTSSTTSATLAVSGSNALKLTITRATGAISGSFKHPVTLQTVPVKAVVFQKQNVGGGNFQSAKTNSNQSGSVELTNP